MTLPLNAAGLLRLALGGQVRHDVAPEPEDRLETRQADDDDLDAQVQAVLKKHGYSGDPNGQIAQTDQPVPDRAVDPSQSSGMDNHLKGNQFDPILARLVEVTGAVPPTGYNGRYW